MSGATDDHSPSPLPWRADNPREFAGVKWDRIIRSNANDPVCSVFFAGFMAKEAHANAQLICRAVNDRPALIAALEEIRDMPMERGDDPSLLSDIARAALELARKPL